jgi:glycosyltransferase involved in cell wall biosynthesis
MKILIDIRPLMDEQYSGVSEYVIRLLEALFKIDEHNDYVLFCNGLHQAKLPEFKQANVKIVQTHIPNKIFNYVYLWFFGRPYFDRLVNPSTSLGKNEKVDIFFMPHLHFAAISSGVKSILTVHDISFLVNKKFFSWRKNVWHWFVNVKSLVKRFDKIVAVSENTKRDLMAICKVKEEKIKVIYSGILESFTRLDLNDPRVIKIKEKYNLAKPFILFLATIEPRKNIIGLVKAFEILKENNKYSDLQLVIAGGQGWKALPIIKAIKSSLVQEDIIMLDYVGALDRVGLYNLAKVFSFPSFYEGFGFPPLEAMACGTPVVTSANSSLGEIVGDAGILVDPFNPESIALGLKTILDSEDLAKELSLRGVARARKFNWENTAREYLNLFEELYG